MTEALTVYEIPDCNLPGLLAKLEKLSKKSVKINGKEIHLNILKEVKKPRMTYSYTGARIPVLNALGEPTFRLVYNVTIDAEVPKIHGWTFLATLDHSNEAGNIIRSNPNTNFEAPEKYRTVGPLCEHCGKTRKRNDTFLLRCDATGEVKQIGRQCIRDFIGYDVEGVVAMNEIVSHSLPSDEDGGYSGGFVKKYIKVSTYLAHAAAIIEDSGWVSKGQAEALGRRTTAGLALDNMFPPRHRPKDFKVVPLTEKNLKVAEEALAWGQTFQPKTGYEYNLSIVAQETFVDGKQLGFLASLIPTYMRHMELEFNRVQRNAAMNLTASKHVGAIKDRLKEVSAVLYGYSVAQRDFGTVHTYRFQTDDGDMLIWYATDDAAGKTDMGLFEATNRTPVILSGRVKSHREWEGVKQTVLTHCVLTKKETELVGK